MYASGQDLAGHLRDRLAGLEDQPDRCGCKTPSVQPARGKADQWVELTTDITMYRLAYGIKDPASSLARPFHEA
jgi:hypothetical protein